MPHVNLSNSEENDFEIEKSSGDTPETIAKRQKAKLDKERSERLMKEQMDAYKKTREDWDKERFNDLKSAKEALQADLEGKISTKEFIKKTSGVYGFFGALWAKMTVRKKSASVTQKIDELDRMITAQTKQKEQDKERSQDLQQQLEEKEAKGEMKETILDEKGDLGYHEYTGKGYKFEQARAETLGKTKEEKTLTGVKKNAFDKAMIDLDNKQEELSDKRDAITDQIKSFANEKYKYEDLKTLCENDNKLNEVRGKLNAYEVEDIQANKRLEEIAKERKKLNERVSEIQEKVDINNEDVVEGQDLYEKALKLHDKVEAQYKEKMQAVEEGKTLTEAEKNVLDTLDKQYTKIQKHLQKITRKYKAVKRPRDNAELDMDGLKSAISGLDEEEKALKEEIEQRKNDRLELKKQEESFKKTRVAFTSEYGSDYDKIVDLSKQSDELTRQIEVVKSGKEHLEKDILNTDVTEFLIDNAANDTVKGITVNGKVYLDDDELKAKGITDPKINEKNAAKIKEIEKIVRALKSRDVFKYANGLNLGEYATFNEKTGKFDLYEGSIKDAEGIEKFNQKFQKDFFSDSNVYSDYLIEKDPKAYRNQMIAGAMKAALVGVKTAAVTAIKSVPGMIKKTVSEIPFIKEFVGDRTDEDYIKDANPDNIDKVIDMCTTAIDKRIAAGKEPTKPSTSEVLAMAMADATVMKSVLKTVLIKKDFDYSAKTIGKYIKAIEASCRNIIEGTTDMKAQKKAMTEMLKAGHQRFGSMMKQAFNQSKTKQFDGIIDLTTNVISSTTQMSTGYSSLVFSTGLSVVGGITKKIHSAVMNHKSKEEFLNSPNILGGIDYDKKLVSKDDFDRILKSVTGINSRDDLSNALHVMDAVDLLKAAKATKGKDKEVYKSMQALGFKKVSKWNKLKVADILKRTTGKDMDVKKTLRNATEKEGFHFGSFFQKIWKTIAGTKSGRAQINASREELLIKNQEKQKLKDKGLTQTYRAKGATNIYEMYKATVMIAEKENKPVQYVMDPKTNQPLDLTKDRVKIIEYFSKTKVAPAAGGMLINGFTAEQQKNFVKSAVSEANGMARQAIGLSKEAPKAPEKNQVQNEKAVEGFAIL